MAKDVDLSSKEWTDIVFQGKNKEFGAYTLRADSIRRHTLAVIIVVAVLAIVMILLWMKNAGLFEPAEEDVNANAGQELTTIAAVEDIPEEEDQPLDIPEPEPEEVQQQDDVTATQAVTEVKIVEEVDKEKQIKDTEAVLDNTAQLGAENREGKEDATKEAVKKEVVEEAPPKVVDKPTAPVVKDEGPVNIAMVEQKPSFPGGDAAMYQWLSSNINYPAAASEEGVQGKVTVQFIVERDGHISGVKVVRGKHPALDAEAKRVVSKMPKWTPGRNNGQPVRVIYNLPVTFRLQ